jgi:hypothetical protein
VEWERLVFPILDCALSASWSVLFACRVLSYAALEVISFGSSQRPAKSRPLSSINGSRPLDTGNDRSGSPSSILLLAKVRALDTRRLDV